jgi:hypothetical protein
MRSFLTLHPGYNTIPWAENAMRAWQQSNTYDSRAWAVANAWA